MAEGGAGNEGDKGAPSQGVVPECAGQVCQVGEGLPVRWMFAGVWLVQAQKVQPNGWAVFGLSHLAACHF
jgi:hypothetical protein